MKDRNSVEELFKDIMMDNTQPLTLPELINESSSPHIKEETVLCDEVNLMDSKYSPADHTPYQSSYINDEWAPCEFGILTSPDTVAPTDQNRLCSYIKEEPFSSDVRSPKDPNFYTSTDHRQYLASHIKEETNVHDERHFIDLAIFTAPDHLQQYPSNIQKDPVSCDGERISNIYPAPDNTATSVCTNGQNLENNSNSKLNEIEVIYQHPVQSTFGDISNLTKYQRAHSRKKTPQCPECGEYFLRNVQLASHQRLHMGQNPLQCPECGRTFSRTSQLINHQRNHKGKKSFKCSECGQFWPDKAQLVLHQESHADEKQSMCLDCGKHIPCDSHLVVHQRTHTGGRPFTCSFCGTHVTVREHLIHLRSHQGEKLDECIQCEKHSKHKVSLTNHEVIHHPMK
ncbi:zinc finger protein 880-like [Bufo bufo]|uniref:zinc finger protein 880-like n=1 Tax=Bufo bufo TaxID=8384 RepID=UPI001ABED2E7|nr:zinc finger protein 880-like [Bufo bufo]